MNVTFRTQRSPWSTYSRPIWQEQLRMIAKTIPSGAQVTWGMTETEKAMGDYIGYDPIDGVVLREIVCAQE